MCGKPAVSSSVLSDSDEGDVEETPEQTMEEKPKSGVKVRGKRANETPEEKRERRRLERKRRRLGRLQATGALVTTKPVPKKLLNLFSRVWDEETAFVSRVMQCLPEVRQPGLLLEEEEREQEHISTIKRGKELKDEEREKEKAKERIRRNMQIEGVELTGERAKSYQELKQRLQQKLAGKVTKPNLVKREKKLKKKLKKREEAKSNKGKKLISQSAVSAGTGNAEGDVKPEIAEKTPLKKKPVVKSNGEIVYSKFDFISKDNNRNGVSSPSLTGKVKKEGKFTAEDLLKRAEKQEKKISSLAAKGKQSEAVDLAVSQKWDTALKRADGIKVKDDPYLLKKTIKKQEKLKQLTKKKWKERVERVEKQKEQRQQKRQSNLQARKDEKTKRVKKLMRKRGRIA